MTERWDARLTHGYYAAYAVDFGAVTSIHQTTYAAHRATYDRVATEWLVDAVTAARAEALGDAPAPLLN